MGARGLPVIHTLKHVHKGVKNRRMLYCINLCGGLIQSREGVKTSQNRLI